MRTRIVSAIMLTLLLVGMLTLAFKIQLAKASGTIYIRADGSIDPPTAPIQRDGDIYTFTDHIYDSIVVERDNIVIDGRGYTLQGTGVEGSKGIDLSGRADVTVQNIEIKNFCHGIYLISSSNNNISGNNITVNANGIYLIKSPSTSISKNTITNNSGCGIFLVDSANNSIFENRVTNSEYDGIWLYYSSYNNVSSNNVSNNRCGIEVSDSSYDDFSGNTITNSYYGIMLAYSSNCSLYQNTIAVSFYYGIYLFDSSHNTMLRNTITNYGGVCLDNECCYNTISENTIINNAKGIELWWSSDNYVYHNNFINNTNQIDAYISVNIWDDGYPSGGNYWSDYTGLDANNDGIGDTSYTIDADNIDHYPLIHAWNSIFSEQQVVALINGTRAYNYDLELENIAYSHYAFRSGGSLGANETANWIKSQFESFGLEAWLEPFEFTTWNLLSKPSLLTDDDGDQGTTADQIAIPTFQCEHWSWPTPESGIFADLVILPLPEAANIDELSAKTINMTEWNAIDTTGKILLIGREVSWCQGGLSTFLNKILAQPPAAIVRTWWFDWMSFVPDFFNSAGGRPISGWGPYFWDLEIPVGFVNYEDGLTIRNRENALNISAHVSVNAVISTGTHYNVVGKIRGYQNPEKVIIISSHYDTVMCSGFCDNGAGTAGVIELAKVFGDLVKTGIYKPRYTLLFVPFTSEELYLVGSINYVKQHKSEMPNIKAVVNLDCIGSDDLYVTETNPVNEFDLDQIILNAAQDLGIPATLEPAGASDQETFRDPSWANDIYGFYWGLDAEISDATPVESSALIISYPLLYNEKWSTGTPGWIHTSYDNSTSTETLNWVEAEDLENHIKVAALTIVRILPDTWHIAKAGDLGSGLPPRFFAFDEKVNGFDLALFVQCYKGLAPPETMYLGDLGSGTPPEFFKCDGKVDGLDLALFIACYKGLGPDP